MKRRTKEEKRNFVTKAYQIIGICFGIAGLLAASTVAVKCDTNQGNIIPWFIAAIILLGIGAFILYDYSKYCKEHNIDNN